MFYNYYINIIFQFSFNDYLNIISISTIRKRFHAYDFC